MLNSLPATKDDLVNTLFLIVGDESTYFEVAASAADLMGDAIRYNKWFAVVGKCLGRELTEAAFDAFCDATDEVEAARLVYVKSPKAAADRAVLSAAIQKAHDALRKFMAMKRPADSPSED